MALYVMLTNSWPLNFSTTAIIRLKLPLLFHYIIWLFSPGEVGLSLQLHPYFLYHTTSFLHSTSCHKNQLAIHSIRTPAFLRELRQAAFGYIHMETSRVCFSTSCYNWSEYLQHMGTVVVLITLKSSPSGFVTKTVFSDHCPQEVDLSIPSACEGVGVCLERRRQHCLRLIARFLFHVCSIVALASSNVCFDIVVAMNWRLLRQIASPSCGLKLVLNSAAASLLNFNS